MIIVSKSTNNKKTIIEVEISREAHEFLKLIVARDNKGLNGELNGISTIESVATEMIEDAWVDYQESRRWRQPIVEGSLEQFESDTICNLKAA
jgi:hypothetical protein